jgi:hypothetical protein
MLNPFGYTPISDYTARTGKGELGGSGSHL